MPGRITPLVSGEYYHLYNRGSDKRSLFLQTRDYKRFQQTFYYYQFLGPKPRFSHFTKTNLISFQPQVDKRLIDILCYCLMPNHFHFLVRQTKENGVSRFMSQLSNSYTKFFNIKYERVGPLLQGAFKAVLIENDEQLLHASRYIHLNPQVSNLVNDLGGYDWSSYSEYAEGQSIYCQTNQILNFFPSTQKYVEFIKDQADYGSSLEILKHQLIEEV